ncbi:hypothetical protein Bca4012_037457 [Brassica carinata]
MQILLDAVSVFNSVTSKSLEKLSVKIAQDGVEVFREFYPKDKECTPFLDCIWKNDKYVLFETFQNRESSKTIDEKVLEDATTRDSLVQYQTSVNLLGEDISPDSPSPLLEADKNVGVTATESSTPLAEAASSKTNNGSQTEDSEKTDDECTNVVSPARINTDTTLRATKVDLLPVKRPSSLCSNNKHHRRTLKQDTRNMRERQKKRKI